MKVITSQKRAYELENLGPENSSSAMPEEKKGIHVFETISLNLLTNNILTNQKQKQVPVEL